MQFTVFEQSLLLQSIGWAIINSVWQVGALWLLYKLITYISSSLSALVKYNLSISLLFTSLLWFILTIFKNYQILIAAAPTDEIFIPGRLLVVLTSAGNLLPYLSILYFIILSFYLARFVKILFSTRFIQKDGLTKAPVDFRLFINKNALHIGIKRKVQVWISENVDVPSVTGFIKPIVLLPVAIVNHLTIHQMEAILLHELAHIRRNDYLVNIFQLIIELVLFFNPFALLLSRYAKEERENCCDDWVKSFQYDQYEYSKALLTLEEQRNFSQFSFALTATNDKKNLLKRVKRLFNTIPQTTFSPYQQFKLACLGILLMAGMFTIFPFIGSKPVSTLNEKAKLYDKKPTLKIGRFAKVTQETQLKGVIKNSPVMQVNENTAVVVKGKQRKRQTKQPENDFVNAFINEELLNPDVNNEAIVSLVAEKEIPGSRIIVKIEDQQSGKKQTNTYIFELNNTEGKTDIKPLIMMNKFKVRSNKSALRTVQDSLNTSKKPAIKKRITS